MIDTAWLTAVASAPNWPGVEIGAALTGSSTALGQIGELLAYHSWRLPYIFIAFGLGSLTAGGEIVFKYVDAPHRALWTPAGVVYWCLNGSLSALVYLVAMRPDADAAGVVVVPDALTSLSHAAIAGLGAQVFIRAKVQFGSGDNAYGPGQLLDRWFAYLDRVIDRVRAQARLKLINELMAGRKFSVIGLELANDLANAMQSLTDQEAETIGSKLSDIENSDLDDTAKARALGYIVLDFGGADFLKESVGRWPKI